MTQPLPAGSFRWLSEEEIRGIDWILQEDHQPVGYILDADLTYPSEAHDIHNYYLVAPERLPIAAEMLSAYAQNVVNELQIGFAPLLLHGAAAVAFAAPKIR